MGVKCRSTQGHVPPSGDTVVFHQADYPASSHQDSIEAPHIIVKDEAVNAHRRPKPRTRTQGACTGCRNRKQKCDGARPSCQACLDLSIACQYRGVPPTRMELLMARTASTVEQILRHCMGSDLGPVGIYIAPASTTRLGWFATLQAMDRLLPSSVLAKILPSYGTPAGTASLESDRQYAPVSGGRPVLKACDIDSALSAFTTHVLVQHPILAKEEASRMVACLLRGDGILSTTYGAGEKGKWGDDDHDTWHSVDRWKQRHHWSECSSAAAAGESWEDALAFLVLALGTSCSSKAPISPTVAEFTPTSSIWSSTTTFWPEAGESPDMRDDCSTLPGFRYFGAAMGIFSRQAGQFSVTMVQGYILAGIYLDQIGRTIPKYHYLTLASRLCEDLMCLAETPDMNTEPQHRRLIQIMSQVCSQLHCSNTVAKPAAMYGDKQLEVFAADCELRQIRKSSSPSTPTSQDPADELNTAIGQNRALDEWTRRYSHVFRLGQPPSYHDTVYCANLPMLVRCLDAVHQDDEPVESIVNLPRHLGVESLLTLHAHCQGCFSPEILANAVKAIIAGVWSASHFAALAIQPYTCNLLETLRVYVLALRLRCVH